jgi:predicted amidohydrolase YtcJ
MNVQKSFADTILTSHAVFTGLADKPHSAAIAIAGNRITAVGTEDEILSWKGPETRVIHLGDRLIMPGFHDFHLHLMMGSVAQDSVNLFTARTREEAVEMVLLHAQGRPEEPWVIGFAWDAGYWTDQRLPDKASLDKIISDRPVLLFHAEGHYAWVNSKALELAGIDRDTPDPAFGKIEKDANSEPTGILYEGAIALCANSAFDFSPEKKKALFRAFLDQAAKMGVTSVNDLYGTEMNRKLQDFELFREYDDSGDLTVRIHLLPALDGDMEEAKRLRDTYRSPMLQFTGLKQFIDGVITGYTAYMLNPYADDPSTNGSTAFPPEQIKQWVVEADREGFQIRFHAIGDGAIRLALDAFEEAQKANGKRDSRHCIEHVEVLHSDDVNRFAKLGVIASMQPEHMAQSERGVYTSRIGREREQYVFALNTLKETGAVLALGSDYPIASLQPMLEIYRAVTRVDSSGHPENVWHPHERLTMAEALRAYTLGSAYGSFREHELGTLEAGKLADIVVLDRNLFAVPAEEILETNVCLTMVDGKLVYESELAVK